MGRRNALKLKQGFRASQPHRRGFIALALLLLALAGGGWLFFSPPGGTQADPRVLTATPRAQRPRTLPPGLFTGKVRRAYEVAQKYPELLERMPCYCGCYVSDHHQNNLDCYTDRHAVG